MCNRTWNHRLVKREYPDAANEYERVRYGIYEVFYEGDKPVEITKEPIEVSGENPEEIQETLERMLRCLEYPILNYEDF